MPLRGREADPIGARDAAFLTSSQETPRPPIWEPHPEQAELGPPREPRLSVISRICRTGGLAGDDREALSLSLFPSPCSTSVSSGIPVLGPPAEQGCLEPHFSTGFHSVPPLLKAQISRISGGFGLPHLAHPSRAAHDGASCTVSV